MLLYTKSPYFQKLLEGLPSGMMIFNVNGSMYAVNEAAVRLFGGDRKECLEMDANEIFSRFQGNEQFLEFVERFDEEREDGPVDITYERRDGNRLSLSMTKTILSEYGKAFGFMLSLVDNTRITEMHDRELRVVSENARLHQEHAERLKQLSEGVAHQIRNPLMVISGFARLLRRKSCNRDSAEFFDGIDENTGRLACIVESVAQYTALAKVSMAEIRLGEVVEKTILEWRQTRDNEAPEVEFIHGPLDTTLQADAMALGAAFKELFSNTHDFMKAGQATIRINAEPRGDEVVITVVDDGAGIEEPHMEFVFDPFFSTKAVSVGMGLCKVERVMHEHGGSVSIKNNASGGVAVTLVFSGLLSAA